MIYIVTEEYKGKDFYFNIGEIFSGKHVDDIVVSTSVTGTHPKKGWVLGETSVKELGASWDESKKNYPEYFL